MANISIVVHAEGPGELGNPDRDVRPQDVLSSDNLGPAHIVVRRILTEGSKIPAAAIEFKEPLRTAYETGARAQGSKLLKPSVLNDILSPWQLNFQFMPPLIIFLVDSDDSPPQERTSILQQALDKYSLQGAVGVAVKEFEAWLVADSKAINQVIGSVPKNFQSPENLKPGEAKRSLNEWIQSSIYSIRTNNDIRRDLATAMDLDEVANLCPSFKGFRQALLAFNAQNFQI
ncbi:MAG: DUF4276 family protein [Leptolyngbyaceae cyanobacterium]